MLCCMEYCTLSQDSGIRTALKLLSFAAVLRMTMLSLACPLRTLYWKREQIPNDDEEKPICWTCAATCVKDIIFSAISKTQSQILFVQTGKVTREVVTGTKTQLNKNKFSCSTTLT